MDIGAAEKKDVKWRAGKEENGSGWGKNFFIVMIILSLLQSY